MNLQKFGLFFLVVFAFCSTCKPMYEEDVPLVDEDGNEVSFEELDREIYYSECGYHSLNEAIVKCNFKAVKYFIEKKHINPNWQKEKDGSTPLCSMVIQAMRYKEEKYMEIVKYLVEKQKVNVNIKSTKGKISFERTPLHWATELGNYTIVKYLIDHKANVHIKDKYGETPLDRAKKEQSPVFLKIINLLKKST